MDTEDSEDFL